MKFVITTALGTFVSEPFQKEHEEDNIEFFWKAVGGNYTHLKFIDENGNTVILSRDVIKNCVIRILKDENDD